MNTLDVVLLTNNYKEMQIMLNNLSKAIKSNAKRSI